MLTIGLRPVRVARLGWIRLNRILGPQMQRPAGREVLRACWGAMLAVVCSGLVLSLSALTDPRLILIAPLGASAVLVFAVPNSPLAQPWSVVVGNCVSAFCGVAIGSTVSYLPVAAGLAVGSAIACMMLLRALHPPGGAIALTVILATQAGNAPGLDFIIAPVAVDSTLIVLAGIVFNRLTGRRYPLRQPGRAAIPGGPPAGSRPERRLGLDPEALSQILGQFNQTTNIGTEDLGRILEAAEAAAAARRFDGMTCGDVVGGPVIAVEPETRLSVLAEKFQKYRFKTFPVIDADGDLVGIVTQTDLIVRARRAAIVSRGRFADTLLRLTMGDRANVPLVRDIMTRLPRTVRADEPAARLMSILADDGVQAVPVIASGPGADSGRLVGIVTRSDLVSMMAAQLALGRAV